MSSKHTTKKNFPKDLRGDLSASSLPHRFTSPRASTASSGRRVTRLKGVLYSCQQSANTTDDDRGKSPRLGARTPPAMECAASNHPVRPPVDGRGAPPVVTWTPASRRAHGARHAPPSSLTSPCAPCARTWGARALPRSVTTSNPGAKLLSASLTALTFGGYAVRATVSRRALRTWGPLLQRERSGCKRSMRNSTEHHDPGGHGSLNRGAHQRGTPRGGNG